MEFELAIEKAWEIGCFLPLVWPADPVFSLMLWACLIAGFLIQKKVLEKAKQKWTPWVFPGILLAALSILEVAIQLDNSSHSGVVLIALYALPVVMLAGAVLAWIVQLIRKK